MTLLGGSGTLGCKCGEDVAVPDLTKVIICPRCGREWIMRVTIERAPDRSGGGNPPAD